MSTPAFPDPEVLPRHPLTLGDVLSAAFRLYGRRFGQLIVIALIPTLVAIVVAAVAVALVVGAVIRLIGGATSGDLPPVDTGSVGLLIGGVLLLLAVSLIATLVQLKCQGMIALAGRDIEDGRPSTVGDLWRRTHGLVGRAVLLVLLLVVAVIVLTAAIGVLAVWLTGTDDPGPGSALLAVLVIALALAVIYLEIRWAFVLQALALDGDGPLASLGRSWRTTRGAFWRIFGSLIVANLLVAVAGSAVSGVTQGLLVPRLSAMDQAVSPSALLAQLSALAPLLLVSLVGSQVITWLSGPFLVLFTTVLYIDQRRRLGLEVPTPAGPPQWGPGYGAGGTGYPGGPGFPDGPGQPGGPGQPQGGGYPYDA